MSHSNIEEDKIHLSNLNHHNKKTFTNTKELDETVKIHLKIALKEVLKIVKNRSPFINVKKSRQKTNKL